MNISYSPEDGSTNCAAVLIDKWIPESRGDERVVHLIR